ncbi:MAG TPA: hypothetical protein VEA81_15290 [Burkholderiaceae bacterium]|nr:hypothetical protein [Burkholderiaceae bacterium]
MDAPTFSQLLYRYWFYGWLFRDVNRGSLYERAAARRHNQSRSRWLPRYLMRWTVLGALCFAIGSTLEPHAPTPLAVLFFFTCALTVPVNVVTLAAWIGFRVMPDR